MHQADKGDTERTLDLLNERMDKDSIALINEHLASIQPMQGLALPSHALSSVKMYASEQAALLRCLPVPLLGIEGELPAALRIVPVRHRMSLVNASVYGKIRNANTLKPH